jgi:hypothetical protein
MNFKNDALKQVIQSLPGFKDGSQEFLALDQLNYLMFFLISAMNNLTLAKKYNADQNLTKDEQTALAHSLFRDAMMSYAKCFSAAEAKKIKIDINAVIKDFTEDQKNKYKAVHEKILRIRNSYIAHNLDNEYELSTVATKTENNVLYIKPVFTIQTPVGDFDDYFAQCALIQNYLVSKIHKALTRIRAATDIIVEYG